MTLGRQAGEANAKRGKVAEMMSLKAAHADGVLKAYYAYDAWHEQQLCDSQT